MSDLAFYVEFADGHTLEVVESVFHETAATLDVSNQHSEWRVLYVPEINTGESATYSRPFLNLGKKVTE